MALGERFISLLNFFLLMYLYMIIFIYHVYHIDGIYIIDFSIGSLAKDLEEEGVQNVTVKAAVFTGSQNGLRIKSWARPSKGFVQGIQFLNVVMRNVQNPILIDQHYCPHNINCPKDVSLIIDFLFSLYNF